MWNKIVSLLLLSNFLYAGTIQTKALTINQALVESIAQIKPNSSNADDVEKLIGPPAACLPIVDKSPEQWACQWKGEVESTQMINTLTVFFESGGITKVIGLNAKGEFLSPMHPSK